MEPSNKYRQYDLHCHSTASDGELTPVELVKHAVECGVDVLALTDHDVTDGLSAAAEEARRHDLEFISGVEISANWNGNLIHIVGLNFDVENSQLQDGLAGLREQRTERAAEMARLLTKAGMPGSLEGAQSFSSGQILSRTHFAQFLLQAGHIKTMQEAFDRYIGAGKPAYVAAEWTSLKQAVDWITAAGGQAVIAHPGRYKLSATKLRQLIEAFKAAGGKGLEVISGKQDINMTRNLADYIIRYQLFASVGSDYHGPSQVWRNMGKMPTIPKGCQPIWNLWA